MSINVAAIMEDNQARVTISEIQAAMSKDAVVSKMMEAAQTVEDAYEVVKRYGSMKFEEFKVLCNDMMEYFRGPKVALNDDIMDAVVGGGFWGNLWNKYKNVVICVGAGIAIGALFATGIGAVVATTGVALSTSFVAGGVVGGLIGAAAGGTLYYAREGQKNITTTKS